MRRLGTLVLRIVRGGVFAQADERVIDLLEGRMYRFLIARQSLLLAGGGLVDARRSTASVEEGHRRGQTERPDVGTRFEQVGQGRAFSAIGAGQRHAREIRGLGDADSGVGRDQRFFGLTDVGSGLEQGRRQAARRHRRERHLAQVAGRDAQVRLPGQQRQLAFGHGTLTAKFGRLCLGGGQAALGLVLLERRCGARGETAAHDFERFAAGGERVFGQRQRGIVGAQGKVAINHCAGDRQRDRVAGITARQQVGAGRFVGAAQLAPEVDFERSAQPSPAAVLQAVCAGRERVGIERADFAARTAGLEVDLWEVGRSRFRSETFGFLDAGDGGEQVEVVFACSGHQFVERWVGVTPPPFGLDECRGRLFLGTAVGLGQGDFRALVVGADSAAAEQDQAEHRRDRAQGEVIAAHHACSFVVLLWPAVGGVSS